MTKVVKLDRDNPDMNLIDEAAAILLNGGLVAFPTETVYGIGANSLNPDAVAKIFVAKGRPQDNPLILHIAEFQDLFKYAKNVSNDSLKLAHQFWPGPLTMIFEKSDIVPSINTAGMNTVAIRMPSNKIAHTLIKRAGVPVSAPSANLSGKPSPTDASHVISDLYGRVDMIIDGGSCDVGVESTVVDMTGEIPTILRPGGITKEMIMDVVGSVDVDPVVYKKPSLDVKPKSPGMKYKHYSPDAEVYIVKGNIGDVIKKIQELTEFQLNNGKKVGIMATEQTCEKYRNGEVLVVGNREKPETIAKNLFRCLREFDKKGVDVVYAEGFDYDEIGLAIMNRLEKAAGYREINA
ncbi:MULTISPECIES: L-threonylcarbamoyladenylate synthase [Thermoanaerobacterium]|uniref:Threonylcarbamoyl-AMP synthase n=2 Tax=Thermoanaerobacterium TaxID=28895 RepID=W9E8B1_9THEO|nr:MULTISPECIES: L-threonylcarbamoyladenylate synthase [Thermoanaerobacterium]AFK85349.1 Sua5/YciO/YrdC/YwlC family protein [Thermoanaerobacterium saccharolyticum JW/SL-YS485]ETO37196.1 Sua5/YciO/YrdC/YwlC family protein [Thermoanaerobacterium aotearoense SCUT27]